MEALTGWSFKGKAKIDMAEQAPLSPQFITFKVGNGQKITLGRIKDVHKAEQGKDGEGLTPPPTSIPIP